MSRFIVLVLGVCVFSAYSAVHRTQDATLNRIVRSPHYGSSYHHDDFELPPHSHGPPPPPIVYHTQNWSGVAKGLDGAPQGVFSGAAASAQSAAPELSEAFSLAASGTGPVTLNEGGQVKENIGKTGFSGHSNCHGSESHHSAGSFGSKHSGALNGGLSISDEGQIKTKPSLELKGDVAGSETQEFESQSGQFNAGATDFDKKLAGGVLAGYGGSSGHFKSVNNDRESGQRSINSGFSEKSFESESAGYGSQTSQYGSPEGFGETESRGDLGSEFLTDGNSAENTRSSGAFGSQSKQYDLQTSNKGEASFNGQSGQFNPGSNYGRKTGSNQFGQYSGSDNQEGEANRRKTTSNQFGQYSRSGNHGGGANRRFESHGGGYGTRREFENNYGGYTGSHSGHYDDIHRHGKSYHESRHFDQNGKQFGYQDNAGRGFDNNGQVRSTGFSDSQHSSFGRNRGNYGSGSSGTRVGNSDNLGQVEQSERFDAGSTVNQGGAHDFSGTQHVKQSDQLSSGFSTNQAGSQALSSGLSQSTGNGFKKSESFSGENQAALVTGNANGGISSASEAEGAFSQGAGASGQEDIQSTLGSALNLASQGLQTAQQTPCSTCNKGSYALSNAKSHSGSAIALSIGG